MGIDAGYVERVRAVLDGTATGRGRPRDFKPVAPYHGLPAVIVDAIQHLDLRDDANFARASEALEKFIRYEHCLIELDVDEAGDDPAPDHLRRWLQQCRDLDPQPIAVHLAREKDEREARAAKLHSEWTPWHAQKQNCFHAEPITCEPVHLATSGHRELCE